jgi:diacylglycerol kinase family enzyme
MRRVAVVINSASGSLLGQADIAEAVAAQLHAAGLQATIISAEGDAGLEARLDRAVALGADAVIVGGGDGTICAAAQRLANGGTALGILPLGTMNMLAKDLGIPLELEAAVRVLAGFHIRRIDLAEVNGHVFLCNSVLGLPTALGRHRERHRGRSGLAARWSLLKAALRTALQHRPLRLGLALGDAPPRTVLTRALAVANNAYAEGFGQVFARNRLDRGELVLYVAHRFGLWWGVKMLAAMALGAWRRRPELDARSATRITLHSRRRRLRVMNDGEALMLQPPLRYRIHPLALRVVVPA